MVVRIKATRKSAFAGNRKQQKTLFGVSAGNASASAQIPTQPQPCNIVDVGKRRDGGTRYWCLNHKADATAKYGKPAIECRAAKVPPVLAHEILDLSLDKFQGGIALWGAVPAIYDTTRLPMDRGIHVHARLTAQSSKEMDQTFRAVRLLSGQLPKSGIVISEIDAIYYMATSIFGFGMRHVLCSYCGWPHLDKDWFSVHPHRRHLCAGCGKHFRDSEIAIGNPIVGIRAACGIRDHKTTPSRKKLNLKQSDFPGGIQIWGSNPAFLWTSDRIEEEGIHVHAFAKEGHDPDVDETYGQVTIDSVKLDPVMVRYFMAQKVMPSIKDRIVAANCPKCGEAKFCEGESAFTPATRHSCSRCNHGFAAPGRLRNTIANPLPEILGRLSAKAPKPPQRHELDLMPETI